MKHVTTHHVTITIMVRESHNLLRDMVNEVKDAPVHLMRDFNYPDIDWISFQGHSGASQQFLDCLADTFLTQHIREDMRHNAILDLIITSDPDLVSSLAVLTKRSQYDYLVHRLKSR